MDPLEHPMVTKVSIEAIAYALPERVLTNEELARENPTWDMVRLLDRTGVEERRIAADDETALDLGYRACLALEQRGRLVRSEIDTVIFCTETPDHPIPPNSCILHERLGLSQHVMAFDITLACSGFVYSLGIARGLVLSGISQRVLIVTADTYSRLIHPADRSSRCLFGDGAAATIVSRSSSHQSSTGDDHLDVVDVLFGTSGAQYERFIVRAGGARLPRSAETAKEVSDRSDNIRTAEHIEMDGIGVLSFFNTTVPETVRDLLNRNNLRVENVGSFVFHQASKIAVDGIARSLGLNTDRLIFDMRTFGNTVSASVPIALRRAQEVGRIRKDRPIVLCGFGVGLSWASALINP